MPIFESKDQRTKRLFDQIAASLLVKACDQYGKTLNDVPVDGWILTGSLMAQQLVIEADRRGRPLGKAWGRGDDVKALRLLRLFALAAVSRYYWFLDRADADRSEDEKVIVRRSAAAAIAKLCGEDPVYTVSDFLNVDIQFRWTSRETPTNRGQASLSMKRGCSMISHWRCAVTGAGSGTAGFH